MKPATGPRDAGTERLLILDPRAGAIRHAHVGDLPALLRAGDLLVVNDAATLPASLAGTAPDGAPVEIRLAGESAGGTWRAVLFGAGDWRTPTEHRPAPPALAAGDRIRFAPDLSARVEYVAPLHTRLVELRFDHVGDALWTALYRYGRPVQYSYLTAPLELWSVQTAYAARPWAVEAPSAGRPLRFELLAALARGGVRIATLTHAAGLSSTGDAALDAALPLPERFEIPASTVDAIRTTRAAGGRVVAVGTTVVRALEGCAALHDGTVVPGAGVTDLVVRKGFHPRVVDGLFTGMHEPTASHFELLHAFASDELLGRAYAEAEERAYLGHEFGDASLLLAGAAS
jgi:S-adenosylmethionine:tRNA ribosyltransferase-isomerase